MNRFVALYTYLGSVIGLLVVVGLDKSAVDTNKMDVSVLGKCACKLHAYDRSYAKTNPHLFFLRYTGEAEIHMSYPNILHFVLSAG